MPEAARIGDPIEHSLALVGLLAGAVLGAALVVATAATGGAALALAVAGGVSMGGTVGQILGSLVPGVTSGMVSTGSGNVFTNGKMAARAGFTFVADPGAPAALDVVACVQHPVPPKRIAVGSDSVFINCQPAARVSDKTECDGTIAEGSSNVFIGGEQVQYLDIESEVPAWLEWTITGLGVISGVGALTKLAITCGFKIAGVAFLKAGLTMAAGLGAHAAAGAYWGEGSWQQKVTDLAMICAPMTKAMFGRKGALNPFRSEPVYIITGAVYSERVDFELPWRIPMRWHACYFSDRARRGALGCGWESPADVRLERQEDGTVLFWDGQPFSVLFPRVPEPGESIHEGLEGFVLSATETSYELQTKEGLIYRFQPMVGGEALVTSIEDSSGNTLHYIRRNGRLEAIRESHGTWLALRYQDDGLQEILFHHPEAEQPISLVRYRQDNGDLVQAFDAAGHSHRYEYEEHCLVGYTDRNGLSFAYTYDRTEPGGRCIRETGPDGLYQYEFSYDPGGRWVKYANSLGHETTIELDEHRYPVREIDPLGAATTYAYDERGLTIEVADPLGRTTRYRYDGFGDVLEIERPDGRSISMEYDDRHLLVSLTDTDGQQWQQAWDERRRLVQQTSPLGATRRYRYDEHGDLVAHTDPRGHTEHYEQDRYFAVMRTHHDRMGAERRWELDRLGRVVSFADPIGAKTRYRYDECGRVVGVETPLDTTVSCRYDAEGNLVSYRDENGNETGFEYTGINEIGRKLLPDGHTVEYRYNTEDQLVAVVNELGQIHQLRRDAAGRVVEEVDYWGYSSQRRYNEAGEVAEAIDELGQSISYEYDRLGRMIRRETSGGEIETFEYDAADNLVRMSNDQGESTRRYDAEGRVVEEGQGDVSFAYDYDANGNCIERRSTLGNRMRNWFDANDLLVELEVNGETAAKVERDARGFAVAEAFGSGSIRRRLKRDAVGQIVHQQVNTDMGWRSDRSYIYDQAGNLLKRTDVFLGTDRYLYDPYGRIVQWTDPWGKTTTYTYNPVGGLTPSTHYQETEQPNSATLQPRTTPRHTGLVEIEQKQDKNGNTIERGADSRQQQYEWDGLQRLREARQEDGETWTYTYDADGRRRKKESTSGTIEFFWQEDCLVAEVSQKKGLAREYFYRQGSFEPLVTIDNNSLFFFNNEPVGVPSELLSSRGDVAWRARYSATGELIDSAGLLFNFLRFPNQYHDSETGFYYNRFRYFDPATLRFQSKDPLGLAAGEHSHAYAPNVWGWVDPLGLKCKIKYPTDFPTKNTYKWSAKFKSQGHARSVARQVLGKNPVKVGPNKLRSTNGKWQYRAKPSDVLDRHIHLEELNPKTGEVLQNLHLRWD